MFCTQNLRRATQFFSISGVPPKTRGAKHIYSPIDLKYFVFRIEKGSQNVLPTESQACRPIILLYFRRAAQNERGKAYLFTHRLNLFCISDRKRFTKCFAHRISGVSPNNSSLLQARRERQSIFIRPSLNLFCISDRKRFTKCFAESQACRTSGVPPKNERGKAYLFTHRLNLFCISDRKRFTKCFAHRISGVSPNNSSPLQARRPKTRGAKHIYSHLIYFVFRIEKGSQNVLLSRIQACRPVLILTLLQPPKCTISSLRSHVIH